jgi:hypothetical protein
MSSGRRVLNDKYRSFATLKELDILMASTELDFWTYISPPLLSSHASFLSIVWVGLGLMLECFLERLGYVVVAEASEPERPGDFAVLLGHWLAGCEEGAEGIEADEEVLFGHVVMVRY